LAVATFIAVTGASKGQAKRFLKKANNNPDVAISNWFDSGEEPESATPSEPASPTAKTFTSPGLIEVLDSTNAPVLENWTGNGSVHVARDGQSFTADSYYSWGSARANVKVFRGRWYFEVTMRSRGSARIGWATESYAPENDYEGVGSDGDSWSWDGSKQRKYHDEKKDDSTKNFGSSWSSGDVVGFSLDFDAQEIRYYLNGRELGVAFKNVMTLNPLMPCLSIYQNTDMHLNLGPKFKHKPLGFYGLNPTCSIEHSESARAVFEKYVKKGMSLNDSLNLGLMRTAGVAALGEDLGASGPLDPHLLLLAWKLRSKHFFEIFDHEWMVLCANEGQFTFADIKGAVEQWISDITNSEDNFKSFYGFCFDYMLREEGDRATVLGKSDAQMLWDLLGMSRRFKFYKEWLKFWEQSDRKGVTKDTWMMLLTFIQEIGGNIDKYNEDDCWNTCFDDFADYLKETK